MVWKLPSQRSERKPPQIPPGIRIYAIGDVHGRADLLASVLLQIEVDIALHPVARPIAVLLGDYIDRGPDSKEVLDLLVAPGRTPEMVFLKGNHETFLINFLKVPTLLGNWRQYGGLETLVSYGLRPPMNPSFNDQAKLARDLASAMPDSHRKFFDALPLTFACGDFLFVHAGIRPLVSIQQQTEDDLLWIRDDFLLWDKQFEKIVVHGHTPVLQPDVRFNRINIDTGAFATGRLTCMAIEGAKIMPLMDVRDWLDELPSVESCCDTIRTDGLQRISVSENFPQARESNAATGDPSSVAAIHAKRLKEDAKSYDASLRARLDPRRPVKASSHPRR